MTAEWVSREQWMFLTVTFDTVLHIILTEKRLKYGLDKRTVSWIENWLNLSGLEDCNQQHHVQLEVSHKWYTPGFDTGTNTV